MRRVLFTALAAMLISAPAAAAAESDAFALAKRLCFDTQANAQAALGRAEAEGWERVPAQLMAAAVESAAVRDALDVRAKTTPNGAWVLVTALADTEFAGRTLAADLCMVSMPPNGASALRNEVQAYAASSSTPWETGEAWPIIQGADPQTAAALWDATTAAALADGSLRFVLFEKDASNGSVTVGYATPRLQ